VNQLEKRAAQDENASYPRGSRLGRWLRLAAVALPIAFLIVAALVLPGWVPLWPRPVRRALTETFLRGVLLTYTFLLGAGLVGLPVSLALMVRSHHRRTRRKWLGRLVALCLACLVSLGTLETGAAVLRGWLHRFPVLRTAFPQNKPGEYRILVLGESSALGEPYRPWLSVGQIVAWQLQKALPTRRFTVDILAYLGDSLEQQHLKLRTIQNRPDAMIIYSGHNEFAARFEENRDAPSIEEPRLRPVEAAYRLSLRSPFCRLVYELVSKNRLDSPPSLGVRHQLIDPPLCSPSESAEILADFSARLEALVSYCERIGSVPILIIPPANEADYEPSRSTMPPSAPIEDRTWLVSTFEEARLAETTDPARSQNLYEQILTRYPSFAEAQFRLGRLLLDQKRTDKARECFSRALENDGLPIRCKAPFRDVYREVAARHPRCLLIDGRAELMQASPSGLLDDHVLEDTHHPNLKGYVALAGAVLREIEARRILDADLRLALPLDRSECLAHFQIDADRLATACERTSVHYQRVSGYRYDPRQRLEKARRFADAARKLRTGVTPDKVGLPGLEFGGNAGL
jgi:tetratricopeptide (TPR) repeat protein